MSKYVLNESTALVVNGEVYVLAREKEVTKNSVCEQCSLSDVCIDDGESHHLSALCMPEESDGRWFFLRHLSYTEKGGKDLVRIINKCFVHK